MRHTNIRTILNGILAAATVAVGGAALAAPDAPKAIPGEIVVRTPDGVTGSAVDRLAAAAGCEVIRPIPYAPGYFLMGVQGRETSVSPAPINNVTLNAISRLKSAGAVSADPNFEYRLIATAPPGPRLVPNDTLYPRHWDMEMIRMPEAWNVQTSNRIVRVAVVDSGVQVNHPDFQYLGGGSRVNQTDFVTAEPSNGDTGGHGTHVAGTIAATTNNATGVSGIAGWNRGGVNVQIASARVFGSGTGTTLDIILAGIRWTETQNVQVANFSLGGYGNAQAFADAILSLQNRGIVVVAGAGNDDTDRAFFPANYPNVIKVTAVGPNKQLAGYSNFGDTGTMIAAPGGALNGNPNDDIISTWPQGGASLGPGQNGYNAIAGTSMACPHVAGAAALLVAAGAPTANIYTALATTAQTPADGADPNRYGAGVLDVYSALLPYADPDPVVTIAGPTDQGISYFHRVPVTIQAMGVSKIVASGAVAPQVNASDITVEIQTVGRTPSVLATYVGGRGGSGDFDIPTLGSSDVKSTQFTIQVPRAGKRTPFGAGQYRISLKVAGVEKGVQFITIVDKVLPRGRTMVAIPYRVGLIDAAPEDDIFGIGTVFALARYNPIRLPSQDEYARYRSNGAVTDPAARLLVPGGALTFDTLDPGTSISPIGNGYWLDVDRPTTIDITRLPIPGEGTTSPIVTNPVGIRLFANGGGWNMIGAPYLFPVDWGAVAVVVDGVNYSMGEAVQNGVLAPALIGYRNGDYYYAVAPQGQLEPFSAYWVRAYRDCTLIVPPSASASSRSVATGAANDGWRVRLGAIVAGDRDAQNYFGQSRGAADGTDRQDIPKPPAGGGHAYVRFLADGSNGATRSLAFDLRAATNGPRRQEWTAAVSSDRENAEVTLTWEGIAGTPRNTRLVMTDVATGVRTVLNERSHYTYRSGDAGTTRLFKIALEPQASRGNLTLSNLRMVSRAAGSWSIGITSNQEAEITGRVVTLTGRVVGVLAGPTRAEALRETTLRWDGRNADGGAVPAGPYRIEVMARTADQQSAAIHRVIQVIR